MTPLPSPPVAAASPRTCIAWASEILADPGADVDQRDRYGRTALMHTAAFGVLDQMDRLLARGADINGTDAGGETALMRAAWSGQVGAIDRLIAAGADVDLGDICGWTALMRAAWSGQVGAIDRLIAAGADVDLGDICGWTALMHAAVGGHPAAVRHLLAAGVRPDQADQEGKTPLMSATVLDPVDAKTVIAALIRAGADPCKRDNAGRTSIIFYEKRCRADLIAALDAALTHPDLADARRRLLHSLPVAERLRLLPASHAMQCADDAHRGWRRSAAPGRPAP